jgi:sigma-B regulation protein RsbU (phosphoserine phosphatase)
LNSILEITQAINKNSAPSVLFEIFVLILNEQLKIGKIRLLIREGEHFYCAILFDDEFEDAKILHETWEALSNYTK